MEKTAQQIGARVESTCPSCENPDIAEIWIEDQVEYGDGKDAALLAVKVPLCHCGNCGLDYTDDRAERIRHRAVCAHLGLLAPEEIVAIRERHRMSQQTFAQLSRIGRASLARWESGVLFQNGSSDSLLFLLGFPDNIQRLKERHQPLERASDSAKISAGRFRCLTDEQVILFRATAAGFQLHMDA